MEQIYSWEGKNPSTIREIPRVLEPDSSLAHAQAPATYPHTEPVQSIPSHPIPVLDRPLIWFSNISLGLTGLPTSTLHAPLLSPIPVTCPAVTIIDLSSGLYLVRNIDHKHPRYIKYKSGKSETQIVPHRKQFISVIKSSHLILLWEIIASYICI